jgi:hypothetical protein
MPPTRHRVRLPDEGRRGSDRPETGDGEEDSSDLARAWALAERNDGERDREHRLKRRDHRREPRRQPGVHRHEEQAELADTDEQGDGDNDRPAHIRPRHEEDRRDGDQSEAQSRKEKRRERFEANAYDDEIHRPTDRDDERESSVSARHQWDAITASVMRLQA